MDVNIFVRFEVGSAAMEKLNWLINSIVTFIGPTPSNPILKHDRTVERSALVVFWI